MPPSLNVTKRDGTKQPLDLNRFHKVVAFACEGVSGVSASEIELKSQIQFFANMKTSDIQETLIKAAAGLISEDTPNYQYVAGRLVNYHLRKQVYGQFEPIRLYDHVKGLVKKKLYDPNLLVWFSEDEFDYLDRIIKHHRDDLLTYAGMEQFRGKYLVQDRTSRKIFETPQIVYILIAATLFATYPKDTRMKWIKDYYDAISQHEISLPTPILAGVRTPLRQYSSCTLIECADSLPSIIATTGAIVKYVSARAGIGIGAGMIRAVDSKVKGGAVSHTGVRPYYKLFESATKSASQGGVRAGKATLNFHFFHYEFEDLIVLKNNKGTEDTRIRGMDYCIQLNLLFYKRYLAGENITLFSPHDVPELMEAFYSNAPNFEELYIAAENSRVRKKTIPAVEMMESIVAERISTGRVYIMNIDHCNDHSSFIAAKAPIRMTNLCTEVMITTKPSEALDDPAGEIALCILAALNLGAVKSLLDFERLATLVVRGLNQLIDYQEYPVLAAKTATLARRPVGVGLMNFAYWMAKNGMTYSNPDLNKIDEMAEAWSYWIIKASADLAEETGACPKNDETKYSLGIVPLDTYKKSLDSIVTRQPTMPWEELRQQLKRTGIKNSTLLTGMPGESSSQTINATSGFDAVRSLVTTKQSQDNVSSQVVPEIRRLKNEYELLWDIQSMDGTVQIIATMTKWMDQSISMNTSYNPAHYEGNEVPESVVTKDILNAYKYGVKTHYYLNALAVSNEGAEEECEACSV